MVQSAGPVPALHDGPEAVTSMCHSPPVGPVTFIWYVAPIPFASSGFLASAAGRSWLKSFLISTAIGYASSERSAAVESVPHPVVKLGRVARGRRLSSYGSEPTSGGRAPTHRPQTRF